MADRVLGEMRQHPEARRPATRCRLGKVALVWVALTTAWASQSSAQVASSVREVMVRDITSIAGVRDNPLVGYGLVIGLHGTGDSQMTLFTVQTLSNAMQKMGFLIPPAEQNMIMVKNVAAVFITATLPPFSRPGERLDVTVSSVGDARSLEGGVLLMSELYGPDGKVYGEAQGPLVMGGYVVGKGRNAQIVNPTNVGTIPGGGIVERDAAVDLSQFRTVSLLLHNPDFNTATEIAQAVNGSFDRPIARALDSGRVDIDVSEADALSVPTLIARVQNLKIIPHIPARIVINERTGTIVMGGAVKLSPVSVLHGDLSIQVVTTYVPVMPPLLPMGPMGPGGMPYGGIGPGGVASGGAGPGGAGAGSVGPGGSGPGGAGQGGVGPGGAGPGGVGQGSGGSGGAGQGGVGPGGPGQGGFGPGGGSAGVTPALSVVPETTLNVNDVPAQTMKLDAGANVEQLVNGLHAIGATAHDVVAILQAIQAEGGMQADLEVQ